MKPNSDRVNRVLSYFDVGEKQKMRLEFCSFFKVSEQTFRNKVSNDRLQNTFFSGRQIEWLENWAKENGMPDDYQAEEFIGQIPAKTEE